MTNTVTMLLCQQSVDGQPEPTTWGAAVLLGTTTAELGKWADLDGDHVDSDKLPDWLIRQGRRRAREAQAATGVGSTTAAMTHWAVRDFSEGVVAFDMVTWSDVHQLWMIVTSEVAQRITGEAES
ncbi:hypothetical protein ACJH6J_24690 [Mycobacterium sp. SMC-18]|uniref:hypothetical protein n=1 Tax=unclassified Mycobacterium TaxID=2642494 RepID=UPI00093C5B51|nr:hypothetical protein [Mycobacterium sp. ST-F2]OKH78287.1 hypothetical protein EB75_28070 [Mycobacterium sp. ST-F2]